MKNPNGINLIEGEWYLVYIRLVDLGGGDSRGERALKYTSDYETAYYGAAYFCDSCDVVVECALRKHYD